MTTWRGVREAWGALGDLVLPVPCGACGGSGGALCAGCRTEVRASAGGAGPRVLPGGGLLVWSGARFEGALREAVSTWKDAGRADLSPVLAVLLGGALSSVLLADAGLRSAVAAGQRVLVVPVPPSPTARRRRGHDPVGGLAVAAATAVRGPPVPGRPDPLVVAGLLRHRRRVEDQSRLGRAERHRNLAGALELRPHAAPLVDGAPVVIVDDVVTTGATLLEASRVLLGAGAGRVVAATVAATPPPSGDVARATRGAWRPQAPRIGGPGAPGGGTRRPFPL